MTDIEKAVEEAKAAMLPFESWERLKGESSLAFAAFCAFRDFGPERNVRKAVDSTEKDEGVRAKRYHVWKNWCCQFRWKERAADFDSYVEKLKAGEMRKTIEAQGELQREVTGKLLTAVSKRVDALNPVELPLALVTDWVETAIKAEREAAALVNGKDGKDGKPEPKQGEFIFTSDFQGL